MIARRKQQQTDVRTALAQIRVAKGVYQHELAHATGISIASYRRLERGESPNAPLWWYMNCAIALNVDLEEVIGKDAMDRWRPSKRAPQPPDDAFLSERYDRALSWSEEADRAARLAADKASGHYKPRSFS